MSIAVQIYAMFSQKYHKVVLVHNTQMSQLVNFPTRAHNTLNLLFITHPDSVLSCHPAPGLSDHDAVLATIQTSKHMLKKPF